MTRPKFEVYAEKEHAYYDATKLLENFVFGIDIPTIAAINGPSLAHTEFALLCDITLAAETGTIIDPHLLAGTAPGDGRQLTLQELIGTKGPPITSTPASPSAHGKHSNSAWSTRCCPPTVSCPAPGNWPRPPASRARPRRRKVIGAV